VIANPELRKKVRRSVSVMASLPQAGFVHHERRRETAQAPVSFDRKDTANPA
jgi:hypothetical protein